MTVGPGISPSRQAAPIFPFIEKIRQSLFAGYTAGRDFHPAPKKLYVACAVLLQTKTACTFIIAQAAGCVNMRIVPVVFWGLIFR